MFWDVWRFFIRFFVVHFPRSITSNKVNEAGRGWVSGVETNEERGATMIPDIWLDSSSEHYFSSLSLDFSLRSSLDSCGWNRSPIPIPLRKSVTSQLCLTSLFPPFSQVPTSCVKTMVCFWMHIIDIKDQRVATTPLALWLGSPVTLDLSEWVLIGSWQLAPTVKRCSQRQGQASCFDLLSALTPLQFQLMN